MWRWYPRTRRGAKVPYLWESQVDSWIQMIQVDLVGLSDFRTLQVGPYLDWLTQVSAIIVSSMAGV